MQMKVYSTIDLDDQRITVKDDFAFKDIQERKMVARNDQGLETSMHEALQIMDKLLERVSDLQDCHVSLSLDELH